MDKIPAFDKREKQIKAHQMENDALRKAKQAIEESEALYRHTLENISDTVILTDDRDQIIYASPNSEVIFGLSQDEIYQKATFSKLLNGSVCDLQTLKALKEIPRIEWLIQHGSGEERFLLISAKLVSDRSSDTVLYVIRDNTERIRAMREKQANLKFFKSMDLINRSIQRAENLEQMLKDVLDNVLSIFNCDRAYLLYSLDSNAETWTMPIIRCRPGYQVDYAKQDVPWDPLAKKVRQAVLTSDDPVKAGIDTPFPLTKEVSDRFNFKAFLGMALYPKADLPWMFAIHQASYDRVWNPEEERLFKEIGLRMTGGLTSFLMYRNLQESEQRYRMVFENSPVAIWEKDFSGVKDFFDRLKKEGISDFETYIHQHPESFQECVDSIRVVDVNRAAWALHGAASKKELLANLTTICSPEAFELMRKELVCLWRHETGVFEDTAITTLGGERRDVLVYFAVCPGYEKSLGKVFVSCSDITARKKLENQLRQSQKMESIGKLAGGIAHDFNNILSTIIGYAELALDETQKGTAAEDNLQKVYIAGMRAKDLVRQILAFARQSDEKRDPVQPGAIAVEVLEFIRSAIPSTIDIRQEIQSETPVLGNTIQLHHVLMNLCTNAAHAMEESGGVLGVRIKDVCFDKDNLPTDMKAGKYVEIGVSDTGVGIAPEIIGSIFEPYFTTKGPGEGTGMGLAMAQGVIESYRGKIIVNSQLGKGTTFTIYLPVTQKRTILREDGPQEVPSGWERILFIDDELTIAEIGSTFLKRLGYSVTMRTSSIEAFKLFQSKPYAFDLVVTDMTMPNLTGDKLAAKLRKIRQDIPVILCTGYNKKIFGKTAANLGIKALVYKPVVKAKLAKTVRAVLDAAKG